MRNGEQLEGLNFLFFGLVREGVNVGLACGYISSSDVPSIASARE